MSFKFESLVESELVFQQISLNCSNERYPLNLSSISLRAFDSAAVIPWYLGTPGFEAPALPRIGDGESVPSEGSSERKSKSFNKSSSLERSSLVMGIIFAASPASSLFRSMKCLSPCLLDDALDPKENVDFLLFENSLLPVEDADL